MKEDRLWKAIGGADPALLERSCRRKRKRVWPGWAAASCLALAAAAALVLRPAAAPVEPIPALPPAEEQPVTPPLVLAAGEGSPHLLQLRAGESAGPDFILYINEEQFTAAWEGEDYVIRPLGEPLEGLPECSLTVAHRAACSLAEAEEAETQLLRERYAAVLEPTESGEGRRGLYAYESDSWDGANAAVTLVEDGQGGVYVLTARFFTEAAEGFGAWFADMASTFTPVPETAALPDWMARLQETVGALTAASFSGQWTAEAKELLTENAQVSAYGGDVSGEVSIAGTDLAVEEGEPPSSAVATVRHRLSFEEPYEELTIRLAWEDGQWRADFIGLAE